MSKMDYNREHLFEDKYTIKKLNQEGTNYFQTEKKITKRTQNTVD